MGHHSKHKNVALVNIPNNPLLAHICLAYAIFQNLALSLFSIYCKIYSCKNLRKPTGQILRKICHGRTNRQVDRKADGKTNRTDFIGPPLQRQRFDHVSRTFENKILLNYLAYVERINIRKRNTININQGLKSSKTIILSTLT